MATQLEQAGITDPVEVQKVNQFTEQGVELDAAIGNVLSGRRNDNAITTPTGILADGTPLNPESLENQQGKVQIPQPTNTFDTSGAFVGSVQDFIKQFETQRQKEAETEGSRLTDQLGEDFERRRGRADRQAELDQEAGIPENVRRANELNLQIAQDIGEFDRLEAGLEAQGRGMPLSIIRGQQGAVRRQKAVEVGAKAAYLSALQGNIQLAQQLVDRTLKIEFQDIEDQINETKTFLDLNNDILGQEQNKQATALKLALDERERVMNAEKDAKKEIYNLALGVAQAGGDPSIVDPNKSLLENVQNMADAGLFIQEQENVFQTETVDGRRVRFEFDKQGNLISQIDLGRAGIRGSSGGGSGTTPSTVTPGFLNNKVEKDVREDIVTVASEIASGDSDYTSAFNRIRALYGQAEVSDEAIINTLDQALGFTPGGENTEQTEVEGLPGEINITAEDFGREIIPAILEVDRKSRDFGRNVVKGTKDFFKGLFNPSN